MNNKLPAAANCGEMHGQVRFVMAVARLEESELRAEIERLLAGLERVNSPESWGFARPLGKAYVKACEIFASVERVNALKSIYLVLSNINMGWI